MRIYKVLTDNQYRELRRLGQTPGAPVDVADGFVHFSTAVQLRETLAKHFAGQDGLWLLEVDAERRPVAQALEWEPSRGGDLFPHLYASLRWADIERSRQIVVGPDGHHLLPADLP